MFNKIKICKDPPYCRLAFPQLHVLGRIQEGKRGTAGRRDLFFAVAFCGDTYRIPGVSKWDINCLIFPLILLENSQPRA